MYSPARRSAEAGENEFLPVFLPWSIDPTRRYCNRRKILTGRIANLPKEPSGLPAVAHRAGAEGPACTEAEAACRDTIGWPSRARGIIARCKAYCERNAEGKQQVAYRPPSLYAHNVSHCSLGYAFCV
jgi:hypothetical protein